MRKDLILLSKILSLSVVVYQVDLWKNKSKPDASDSETPARTRYLMDEEIPEEIEA